MKTLTFNVYLNRKLIDTVIQSFNFKVTKANAEEYVKDSLINHDGYDQDINIRCVTPLTELVYELWINYGQGWELETTECSLKELKEQQNCYRQNSPEYPTKRKVYRKSIFR